MPLATRVSRSDSNQVHQDATIFGLLSRNQKLKGKQILRRYRVRIKSTQHTATRALGYPGPHKPGDSLFEYNAKSQSA